MANARRKVVTLPTAKSRPGQRLRRPSGAGRAVVPMPAPGPARRPAPGCTQPGASELLGHLWDAITENRVVVHYQPQFDMRTGAVVSMEALVRFEDAAGTLHRPATFIAEAEDSGLIVGLGRAVARQACLDLAHWRAEGFPIKRVAINLSANQLNMDTQLVTFLDDTLSATGLAFSDLEFELTERQLLDSDSVGGGRLSELYDAGSRIALDDFGTGFSSLAYLLSLDIHTIKLDCDMVRRLPDDATAARVIEVMVRLAKDLDLEVVAEGIELESQRVLLADMGCDLAQGFCFTPPLPMAELKSLLIRH